MKILLALLITLLIFNYAHAEEAMAGSDDDTFTSLDSNQDGFLTMEEVTSLKGLPEKFEEADRNQDGKLALEEFNDVSVE